MSTNWLFAAKINGKVYGQYRHWDGYPAGAGVDIFKGIKNSTTDELADCKSDWLSMSDDENEADFASVAWCAWVWMYDYDSSHLRVFSEHETEPLPEGEIFAHLEPSELSDGGLCYAPKELISFSLDEIKRMTVDCFLEKIDKKLDY